jgi:alpha-L-rhamnosidase
LFIAALCLAWAVYPTPAAAQGGPRDLRCENAVSPKGVKTAHPQFSWTFGGEQRGYQILVASSEEKLKGNDGDLWDSGRVFSAQKTAQYKGKPLASYQHCYWKIRVWGNYYQATGYSDPESWQMGVLHFDSGKGK